VLCIQQENYFFGDEMKEPGLDGRRRDENGRIDQKRGDTLNKNLSQPIPNFSPLARLDTMRKETGKTSISEVRDAAKRRK
jgi:hypothetical protein